jgi:hypothetical protein
VHKCNIAAPGFEMLQKRTYRGPFCNIARESLRVMQKCTLPNPPPYMPGFVCPA